MRLHAHNVLIHAHAGIPAVYQVDEAGSRLDKVFVCFGYGIIQKTDHASNYIPELTNFPYRNRHLKPRV